MPEIENPTNEKNYDNPKELERIRLTVSEIMAKKHLRQIDLAHRAKLGPPVVGGYVNGRSNITLDTLISILKGLNSLDRLNPLILPDDSLAPQKKSSKGEDSVLLIVNMHGEIEVRAKLEDKSTRFAVKPGSAAYDEIIEKALNALPDEEKEAFVRDYDNEAEG